MNKLIHLLAESDINLFSMQGFLLLGVTVMDKFIPIEIQASSDGSKAMNGQVAQENSNGHHSSSVLDKQTTTI